MKTLLTLTLLGLSLNSHAFFNNSVSVEIDWKNKGRVIPKHALGHNTVWSRGGLGIWNEQKKQFNSQAVARIKEIKPGSLRFPGGTRSMMYRFWENIGPFDQRKGQCDSFSGDFDTTTYGIDEFMQLTEQVNSDVVLVAPWTFSTPEEVAAMVAYVNGDTNDTTPIGDSADAKDDNDRNWKTVGYWAQKRATNGHPAAYKVKFLEMGNEQFLHLGVPPNGENKERPCWCDQKFPVEMCETRFWPDRKWTKKHGQVHTTVDQYGDFIARLHKLIRKFDQDIKITAQGKFQIFTPITDNMNVDKMVTYADEIHGSNQPWNKYLYDNYRQYFDLFVLHPYRFLPYRRNELGLETLDVLKQFREKFPETPVGLTEFGLLLGGGSIMNSAVSADVIHRGLNNGAELLLRHILIEDPDTGYFASSGAIQAGKKGVEVTSSFYVMKYMAKHSDSNIHKITSNSNPTDISLVASSKDKSSYISMTNTHKSKKRKVTLNIPTSSAEAKVMMLTKRWWQGKLTYNFEVLESDFKVQEKNLEIHLPALATVFIQLK
jgi:alpha-L-arabinofuranosidase